MAKKPDAEQAWDAALVARVGGQVKRLRDGRSAQWLSDRTEEVGKRIPVTVIAKLDSGHRGAVLQVSELLVLAAALGVSPVQLLYPDLPYGEVEVLPGVPLNSLQAVEWFAGTYEASSLPGMPYPIAAQPHSLRLVESRKAQELVSQARSAELRQWDFERRNEGTSDEILRGMAEVVAHAKRRADAALRDLYAKGWIDEATARELQSKGHQLNV